jgi:hypothetical protein
LNILMKYKEEIVSLYSVATVVWLALQG